ncbi:MAG: carbamoyltransferase HypF [Pirellulaceae bacterium]|nr:MAG: carbamoyltransferase HypF [Pirellulaceae bacterium]
MAVGRSESPAVVARRIRLFGRVQGVGVRPAVARLASELGLCGYVVNTLSCVEIRIEGELQAVELFQLRLGDQLPQPAVVTDVVQERVPVEGHTTFTIEHAHQAGGRSPESVSLAGAGTSCLVPPDLVVCDSCLHETKQETNRRHAYPFTTCALCGPRYSIIRQMPYERCNTTMAGFALCEKCREEYTSGYDRRYHAETIACPQCGPQLVLRDARGQPIAFGSQAVGAAVDALRRGAIVALLGVGGYQLLVDATSQQAVERLRERKRRPAKPLAVLVASLQEADVLGELDEAARKLLADAAGPIVVVRKKSSCCLAPAVTLRFPTVGLLLPTTPLHWLLVTQFGKPLVCTSGNVEGEPLAYSASAADVQLADVADLRLEHDRPVYRPIDDSLVQTAAGRTMVLRLARGYAPWPLNLVAGKPVVAVGGHQKVAVALANSSQAVLGPHIGDLDSAETAKRFEESCNALMDLYAVRPSLVVCDLHPDYYTTMWAERSGLPLLRVQHHHAHVVAAMIEHGWLDQPVLGVAFDGTGYGLDGSVWGGEFLVATQREFKRVGCLRPFLLPGGERAIREPWRVAASLVWQAEGPEAVARLRFTQGRPESVLPLLGRPNLSPSTTSAGRLFDGVAALVLGWEASQFEGEAAMHLESACMAALSCPGNGNAEDVAAVGGFGDWDELDWQVGYRLPIEDGAVKQVDWRPMVRQILADLRRGKPVSRIALDFHMGLADAVFRFCGLYSHLPVVLSGGVFQNRVLVELLSARFARSGQRCGLPGIIPVNDGGLAAGQLAVAAARLVR